MFRYRVRYSILTEARTDTFLGSGSTTMDNLSIEVTAVSATAAEQMVQNMNGGWSRCRILSATLLH